MTKIKPIAGQLLVKPTAIEEKTTSGIILSSMGPQDQQTGTVVDVGGNYVTDHGAVKPSPVQIGDMILFKEWGKQKYKMEGEEYYLVKYDDVIAVITS